MSDTFKINLCGYDNAEIVLRAGITGYTPGIEAPYVRDHDHPSFSDDGDPEECEYNLSGFIIFEPDNLDESGNMTGLVLSLTDAQCEEISEHFECNLQICDEARKIYYEENEL